MSELREEHRGDDQRSARRRQYQGSLGGEGWLHRVQNAGDHATRAGGGNRGYGIHCEFAGVRRREERDQRQLCNTYRQHLQHTRGRDDLHVVCEEYHRYVTADCTL